MKNKGIETRWIIAGVKPVSVEEYNTNNAWGFGGMVGTKITYPNGAVIITGKACYRHAGSHAYTKMYDKNGSTVYSDIPFPEQSDITRLVTG